MTDRRVREPQYAQRVNTAAELLASGVSRTEAVHVVAQRFSVSSRQAARYVQAAVDGPVVVPETKVVFTVKLPLALVGRVRAQARSSGGTISAVVALALAEFFARRPDAGEDEEPGGQGE